MLLWSSPCSLTRSASVFVLLYTITTQTELVSDIYVPGYEVSQPELCPAFGSQLQLIIFVATAPSHFQQRHAIRMTWGHIHPKIPVAFFIGIPPDSIRPQILNESLHYKDIVIGRYCDTYENLALKSLSMLEWLNMYCPLVERMLKSDDDMFINIPRLLKFIEITKRRNIKKTIWGKLLVDSEPVRFKGLKNFVPVEQFPDEVFPDYLAGGAYLMTTDITRDLFTAAIEAPFIKPEDVFITGILASKLHIKKVNVYAFFNKKIKGNPCKMVRFISAHDYTSTELINIWRELATKECSQTQWLPV
nr:beta-1,3-galactosyltransferase 9-like [Plodia interpunctella]